MKRILLLLCIFHSFGTCLFAQCGINSYIQDNYELDAKLLALRDILADTSDPDYDNPFLPDERITPYLEKLSAIYENPHNDPEIEMIFKDFNIHANQEYMFPIAYKTLVLGVATSLPWVEGFKTTGVSGIPELDHLMSTYQFKVDHFLNLNSCSCHIFFIETGYEFLNLKALIDDFEAITDIDYAELGDFGIRSNYTGIPYDIRRQPTEVCDISIQDDTFVFSLFAGDCPAGCTLSEVRTVTVTDDCQVLTNPGFNESVFSIFPNPATSFINVTGENSAGETTISIFNMIGKQVFQEILNQSPLDVSGLSSGVYIIKIFKSNRIETKKLIIKK